MSEHSALQVEQSPSGLPDLVWKGAAESLMHSQASEILIEGPAGTGKSLACLAKCVMACDLFKCRVLICRATRVSMTESVLVTLERELLTESHPARRSSDVTRAGRRSYIWPHGSELVVRGLDNSESVMSSEYDLIYVPEATETTEEDWERLLTRLRNHKLPFQQAVADCNPGAPSHWLNMRAKIGKMERLLSRHTDNPSVTQDYLDKLRGLTGYRRVRLYDGRWAMAEGSVFPEFTSEKNTVRDFPIPEEWPIWLCADPGYDHPCGVTWNTISPNGTRYTIAEIKVRQTGIKRMAELINEKSIGVVEELCDPAGQQTRQGLDGGVSFTQQMRDLGHSMRPWKYAAKELHDASVQAHRQAIFDGKYKVFRSCVETIAEHQSWAFKRVRGGELPVGDDQYEDRNNDLLDGIMGWERENPQFDQGFTKSSEPKESQSRLREQEAV